MLISVVIGLVVLTTVLIATGLWLMQQDVSSRHSTLLPVVRFWPCIASNPQLLDPTRRICRGSVRIEFPGP